MRTLVKIVLFITCPIWVLMWMLGAGFYGAGKKAYDDVSDLVDEWFDKEAS